MARFFAVHKVPICLPQITHHYLSIFTAVLIKASKQFCSTIGPLRLQRVNFKLNKFYQSSNNTWTKRRDKQSAANLASIVRNLFQRRLGKISQ